MGAALLHAAPTSRHAGPFSACAFSRDFHFLLPYLYTVKFVVLLSWRFYTYKQNKWHLFMLDFCYWTNTLLIVYRKES